MTAQPCRPRERLLRVGSTYPRIWELAALMRRDRGGRLPEWPSWCFLPMAGWHVILNALEPLGGGTLALGVIPALGAWRMTQGIYRFDATLYESLISTPLSGALPCDALYRLPEWCVYVETPGMHIAPAPEAVALQLSGAWAFLEWDAKTGGTELRLVLDMADGFALPFALHLGPWGIAEAARRVVEQAEQRMFASGMQGIPLTGMHQQLARIATPLVSLLLYLCVDEPDFGGDRRPSNPTPVKTRRHGEKLIPASAPTTWDVGVRLGAAIRAAQERERGTGEGTHAGPRPHWRRAHWHSFWTGPRDGERRLSVKWLPPIPVGAGDDLPAVIRTVK